MAINFKLEDFEGPLDLLLFLLHKNKMNIYDIEISSITDQYMAYLESAEEVELDIMSDFIVMASTLILIKSRMLLPKPELVTDLEEDPRAELVRKLIEYKKIKYVSQELDARQADAEGYCFRNNEIFNDITLPKPTSEDVLAGLTLQELYKTYQQLIRNNNLV